MNIYLIQEDNTSVELRVEDKEYSKQSGNIYKGKIKRLVPGMNAAFVDIGQEKEAFLPLKDTCPKTLEHTTNCTELKSGDFILVQVKRSPVSTKGAKLSCKISLPGKYLVLLPSNEHISISSKFEDQELRENLKQRIKELLEPYNPEKYGFIIRTSAQDIPDDFIIEDFLNLKSQWEKILKKAKKKKGIFLLHEEPLKAFSIIRDYSTL
jgi:ribonuclease G